MSFDFKIEIFAYYCFDKRDWNETTQNILETYGHECFKDNSYSEACDLMFKTAVHCRILAFENIYAEEIDYDKAINWRSLSDCYDHVTRVCDRHDWFGHLTIFDRMFATCAYVQYLCLQIYNHSLIDVVKYSYIIWAMYFDKFTEKFYEEGGWNELKRVTNCYEGVGYFLLFLRQSTCTASYRHVWKEASVNYIQFKKAVKHDISKYKHKSRIHVCKLWVKFHIKHFEEYVRIPLSYEDSVDTFETEMLFQLSKLIYESFHRDCDIFEIMLEEFQLKLNSNGMLFSKAFANGEEIKTYEDIQMENLKISSTACKEFPDSRKCLETRLQSECSTLSEEIGYKIIDETKIVKNNSSEMETLANKSNGNLVRDSPIRCNNLPDGTKSSRFHTDIENSTKIAELNYKTTNKCSDSESEKYLNETSPRNEKRQSELLTSRNASYWNHKDETDWPRKNPQTNLPIPIDLNSKGEVTKSHNKAESSKIQLKSSYYTKNEEECYGNLEITCGLSTNELSISQFERNAIPKKMSTPNHFLVANDVTKNSDGRINTNEEVNKLREEQADPEIKNFLRLILVLDERKGIQYVCETLYSGGEGQEISQVRSNKKKKRRTKKSRK